MVAPSILLVDDHAIVREGVKRALAMKMKGSIFLEASSSSQAHEIILSQRPTIAIIDIHLPDSSGLELASWARIENPKMGIIIFSMAQHPEYILNAYDLGASGFVDKAAPISELVEAIEIVASNPLGFHCKDIGKALSYRREKTPLTARELEILRILPTGKKYEEISAELFISESTLKSHLQAIYRKLIVRNRVEAINEARRLQILLPSDPSSRNH
jgi:DNA-binding NarL/FixJ family response regulator